MLTFSLSYVRNLLFLQWLRGWWGGIGKGSEVQALQVVLTIVQGEMKLSSSHCLSQFLSEIPQCQHFADLNSFYSI